MEPKVTAILTNEEGWQRKLPLAEGILWLGSAPDAQIHLADGERIAPYHLEIVNSANEDSLRIVNISGKEMLWKDEQRRAYRLASGGFKDLYGAETLLVGSYTLQFEIDKRYVQRQVVREGQDHAIGLRLVLSGQVLRPGNTLTGTLYLQNRGPEPCQFNVELGGLPPECFEIEPPPLINAGGEESAEIHFYHLGTAPLAGVHEIELVVSAPLVYPGRVITIQQKLKVAPCYAHQMTFVTALADEEPQPAAEAQPVEAPVVASEPSLPPAAAPVDAVLPVVEPTVNPAPAVPMPPAELEAAVTPPDQSTPPLEPAEPAVPERVTEESVAPARVRPNRVSRPDLSAVKVIKASNGDFLEKEEPRR
ncbi:MAG TPA: hypothetical protein VHO48_13360 [Anaerolineaceae bacterium]|nr:hypothetical protein [Anaerolineaceae bacterium]